jgi:hypothetical protein
MDKPRTTIAVPGLLAGCIALAGVASARPVDFDLSAGEARRVAGGELVIRADLDASQRSGTVRAAMRTDASPATVFEALTRCADAVEYVPHLRECRELSQTPDGRVRMVEHEVDLGWYAPRIRYVIRADVVADRSITFRQVSGDFRINEGAWELTPDGAGTMLRYRADMSPPAYVPDWLARSAFRKELPDMLAGLKRHCEASQVARAGPTDSTR